MRLLRNATRSSSAESRHRLDGLPRAQANADVYSETVDGRSGPAVSLASTSSVKKWHQSVLEASVSNAKFRNTVVIEIETP